MNAISSASKDSRAATDRSSENAVPFEPQFARAHKRALGAAVGLTVGFAIFALTAVHVIFNIEGLEIGLLSQYFYGYTVSWPGAFVGLVWGFVTGFIAGWMLGFVHNFTVGFWVFLVRTRNDLKRTSNFLDHI